MRYLNIDNVKTVNLFIESESYTVLKVSYFKMKAFANICLHSKIIQRLWRRKIFKIKEDDKSYLYAQRMVEMINS